MNRSLPVAQREHVVDDDYILGGVAGYLANAIGVDALWVRLGFVLLTLVGGLGVVLYLGLWLVLSAPDNPATDHRGGDDVASGDGDGHSGRRTLGIAVLVAGAPLLLWAQVGAAIDTPMTVLLLVGLAAALWRSPQTRLADATPLAAPLAPPVAPAPPVGGEHVAVAPVEPLAATPPDAPRRRRTGPRIRRPEPSLLGRTTLGIAIAVAAGGALVDQANGGRLHPEQWLGAAAAVCGLGLIVGAVRGRGRWLILPALLFAGTGYVAGSAARLGIDGVPLGDRWLWIGEVWGDSMPVTGHTLIGNVDLGIDAAPASGRTASVDARVGFGDVRVRVDEDVPILVRPRIDHGDVWVDGQRVSSDAPVHVGPPGDPAVVVDARIGRGDVVIWTQTFADPEPLMTVPSIDVPGGESLAFVTDGVAVTSDGWFVINGGMAVIDDQDRVVVGETYDDGSGTTVIPGDVGEFRLLPRGLLVTPYGELLDLRAIRSELAAATPLPPAVSGDPVAPTVTTTLPPGIDALSTIPG